jgi:hypothetical protein
MLPKIAFAEVSGGTAALAPDAVASDAGDVLF